MMMMLLLAVGNSKGSMKNGQNKLALMTTYGNNAESALVC